VRTSENPGKREYRPAGRARAVDVEDRLLHTAHGECPRGTHGVLAGTHRELMGTHRVLGGTHRVLGGTLGSPPANRVPYFAAVLRLPRWAVCLFISLFVSLYVSSEHCARLACCVGARARVCVGCVCVRGCVRAFWLFASKCSVRAHV
jgi:hypothetical protein